MGPITLKICSAQLARDTDSIGRMDPYVKVRTNGGEFRTRVAHDMGKTPSWNETFTINTPGDVHLSIWDKDTFSADDIIAETSINIQGLLSTGQSQQWSPLYYKGRPAGQLLVQIIPSGGGFGMPPQGGFYGGGFPPQGFPGQGFPPQGYPPQGFPGQGFPPQGYPPQGFPPQGFPPQGGYGRPF